jgi:hypothetical protein
MAALAVLAIEVALTALVIEAALFVRLLVLQVPMAYLVTMVNQGLQLETLTRHHEVFRLVCVTFLMVYVNSINPCPSCWSSKA